MWDCGPPFGFWNAMHGHFWWGWIVVIAIIAVGWHFSKRENRNTSQADRLDSLEILKIRLARGEITLDEFNKLKSVL